MAARYNPPPNWPDQPAGWTPPPDWEPDPSWGPPPYGWQLWLEDSPASRSIPRRHLIVVVGFVIGIGALLGYVYLFSAGSDDASTMTSDPDTPVPPHTHARAGAGVGGDDPAAPADQDPAPYAAEPHKTDTPAASTSHPPAPARTQPAPASRPATSTQPRTPDSDSSPGPGRPWPRRTNDKLDPRFSNCDRARAAGYGPYRADQDPEYFWYPDPNRDGVVCAMDESVTTDKGIRSAR